MPTLRAIALVISLFSAYIGSGNFQEAKTSRETRDLVAAASTTNNETKKEDKLSKILPLVTFDCTGRTEGYYADIQFDCEAFHYCKTSGERFTFVCPPKSRFNQKHMICDYDRYGLKLCHDAEKYFNLNENLYPKTEDEKSKTSPSITTTKAKEKAKLPVLKKEASVKEDTPIKPKSNKAKKLEKTYIVTEYYEHDVPTTEQTLIDDASPKIYKWYSPPATRGSPLDEVDYDDSIRHQYEYPDDYHEDGPYYDHSEEVSPKDKTTIPYAYDKDKKSYHYDGHTQKNLNKDKAKVKSSSGNNSQEKTKQHYLNDDSKQSQPRSRQSDALQHEETYEDTSSKEVAYSDDLRTREKPQRKIGHKFDQGGSKALKEPNANYNNRNEDGYLVPVEETQTYEEDKGAKNIEHSTPSSDRQSARKRNYYHQTQLTEENEPEVNYQENNKNDQDQNYDVNPEESDESQPYELENNRNGEDKEYIQNNEEKIIHLSESQHPEVADDENSRNTEKSQYKIPDTKVKKYEVISNNAKVDTHLEPSEVGKSEQPINTKTTTFYHRYTSKTEQPTQITVYGEPPLKEHAARTLYNHRSIEPKGPKNDHEDGNLRKFNSKESAEKQRVNNLKHRIIYRQQLPEEVAEALYNQRSIEQKETQNYRQEDNPQIETSDEAVDKQIVIQSEQPIRTSVYRGEEELPVTIIQYNQRPVDVKDQRNYRDENLHRDTSNEAADKQKVSRLVYTTAHREQLPEKERDTEAFYKQRAPERNQPQNYHQGNNPLVETSVEAIDVRRVVQPEQPMHASVYRGELPVIGTLYNQRTIEQKNQRNSQQGNFQRDTSNEAVDRMRTSQLKPEVYQEELSQEQKEDNGQRGSYEKKQEEVNNQYVHPGHYYREQAQQIQPQRNLGAYVQQRIPQQIQIPVEISPQLVHQQKAVSLQPYENNFPQKVNSGKITPGHLAQHNSGISMETIRIQEGNKNIQRQTVPYRNPHGASYQYPNHRYATNNKERNIHSIIPRQHGSQNNQHSIQYYSTKEPTKPINTYQINRNIRQSSTIRPELITYQHNPQPKYQQNNQHGIREKYIPNSRQVHNHKKYLNVNVHRPLSKQPNQQQQQSHLVTVQPLQRAHQPNYQTAVKQYLLQGTLFDNRRTSEEPKIRIASRRQKRQATGGLPLSNQFRELLNRLYSPVGSASNNHLNNFQDFITSSISSSENSRNPTEQRPTNYFPQQNHYNPRYSNPYNSDALYDRSPVYSDTAFPQNTYYSQPHNPYSTRPHRFRYFDDNGEQLNPININPPKPSADVPSPPSSEASGQKDDAKSQSDTAEEQTASQQSDTTRNTRPTYPPLPTINPQNFPELKDFPFFNPSFPYSQKGNASKDAEDNSQFSYNRIPPNRYSTPDLGVYFDPYGEFGVTPLYDSAQTNSDDVKDSDTTESPASKEVDGANKKDPSRRRVPGRVRRPQNTILNLPNEEKHLPEKPREQTSLFVTAPPERPVTTYNPQSLHLFVTPPSFLAGQSRAPSVFGPEFFVPPLRSPFTTEPAHKEAKDSSEESITHQSDTQETSEATAPATTPAQRQRGHRRRPQTAVHPTQTTRGTTRRPSSSRSSSRFRPTSERGSFRHSSESSRPLTEPSRPTTKRPIPARSSSRAPVNERPKPATLPPVRPTHKPAPESESSDEVEPNPFRGSVPYGTRLRRPPPSRQTSSVLSHQSPDAPTVRRAQQSSASDQSITIARTEPKQRTQRVQTIERNHQPRRAINHFRDATPSPVSSTTFQTPSWTELHSKNIFSHSSEEGTTVGYSSNESKEDQRVRRPSVRRATYIHKTQTLKPEAKPKLYRGRTRVRSYHPRRGYTEATTQGTTSTTKAETVSTTSTTTTTPAALIHLDVETTTTPETVVVETEPTPKLRVYTSRHGGSLRNEQVINRLKDKPRLFTFGRPRGTVDDFNFDDTNHATVSSSESKLSALK